MQSVSSRIWTRVTVSISYDDNHYATGTSLMIFFMVNQYTVWAFGRDWVIRLYLKDSETLMPLILYDGFWLVYILFCILFGIFSLVYTLWYKANF